MNLIFFLCRNIILGFTIKSVLWFYSLLLWTDKRAFKDIYLKFAWRAAQEYQIISWSDDMFLKLTYIPVHSAGHG